MAAVPNYEAITAGEEAALPLRALCPGLGGRGARARGREPAGGGREGCGGCGLWSRSAGRTWRAARPSCSTRAWRDSACRGPAGPMRKRVLGGLAWTGGSQVVMQVVRLFTAVALARLLAPDDYGLAARAGARVREPRARLLGPRARGDPAQEPHRGRPGHRVLDVDRRRCGVHGARRGPVRPDRGAVRAARGGPALRGAVAELPDHLARHHPRGAAPARHAVLRGSSSA